MLKPQIKKDTTVITYNTNSNSNDENDHEDNLNEGGGSELDIESNYIEEILQPQPKKQNQHSRLSWLL